MSSHNPASSHRAIAAAAVIALVGCGDGFRALDAAVAVSDAAPSDASAVDAGVDAAPPDARVIDASVADASAPDASPPDASPPDASPPDARLPDATPPDAAPATVITVFATPSSFDGNLGGRIGADDACAANVGVLSCPSAIHALITIDHDDSVANLPTTAHVPTNEVLQSPSGITIASNWADLLDGSLTHSFGVAGLFDVNSSTDWWSGSNSDGTPSNQRCNDWTYDSVTPTFKGEIGVSSAFNSTWITAGASTCNNTFALICLCY